MPLKAALLVLLLAACSESQPPGGDPRGDPRDAARVALGQMVYAQHCASCHGAHLEGQPNWRRRLPDGRLPAPQRYESDMPAFASQLSDDQIWAVLAFIKSHWKSRVVLAARAEMTRNERK